jgi:hypothetical protein
MPRSKNLAHFPTRYLELISEVAIENKSIEVPCESASQCASFKGHWYSFIGALKAEASAAATGLHERKVEGQRGGEDGGGHLASTILSFTGSQGWPQAVQAYHHASRSYRAFRTSTAASQQGERITGQRALVLAAWVRHGPGTTAQLAERSQISILSLRPRTTELFDLGFICLAAEQPAKGEGSYRARTPDEFEQWARQQIALASNPQRELPLGA